jgi:hypothetical protein
MIAETVIEALITETVHGFDENDECFSKNRDVFSARIQSYIQETNKYLEAVQTAFTKRISGRSPEQRGNGLKFVSEAIQENKWHLYFQSGSGSCFIDRQGINFSEKTPSITGCLAILDFDKVKVLAPSWADEFISGIQKDYGNEVQCINTENPSVKASLKTVIGQNAPSTPNNSNMLD